MPPNIPKRCSKKNQASSIFSIDSIVDISFDETSTIDGHVTNNLSVHHTDVHNNGHHDLRDSGISITENSNLNNFNNICYEEYDLRPHAMLEMNINTSPPPPAMMSPRLENPPPIPPKSTLGGGHQLGDGTSSLERHRHTDSGVSVERGNPENYSIPRLQLESNSGEGVDESSC